MMLWERLETVMIERHLTPKDIANDLNLPVFNVRRYIYGIRTPSNQIVFEFSKKYHVDVVWLLFGVSNNSKRNNLTLDQLPNNEQFIRFVRDYKKTVISFLNNETEYKEPLMIKAYRNNLSLTRKGMRKLMLEALEKIGKEE